MHMTDRKIKFGADTVRLRSSGTCIRAGEHRAGSIRAGEYHAGECRAGSDR